MNGAFVDSDYFEAAEWSLSRHAVDALGWQHASQSAREGLAKLWVEKGLLCFRNVLHQPGDSVTADRFFPPHAALAADGVITVKLWVRDDPVMRRGKPGVNQAQFSFMTDGNLAKDSLPQIDEKSYSALAWDLLFACRRTLPGHDNRAEAARRQSERICSAEKIEAHFYQLACRNARRLR